MVTITEVKDAFIAALQTVKVVNGYLTDIPDDHIYPVWVPKYHAKKEDKYFPKFFVILDEGEISKLPSSRFEKRVRFLVVVAVKSLPSDQDEPQTKLERIVEDFDRLADLQHNLGGTVLDVTFSSFTTDSGQSHPEGTMGAWFDVVYYTQR